MLRLPNRLLVVTFMVILIPCHAAASDCDSSSAKTRFPNVERELASWMVRTEAEISPTLLDKWNREFCAAAIEVGQTRRLSDRAIDEKAPLVIRDFVDREVATDRKSSAMGAILLDKLGTPAFARPIAKVSVKIEMQYAHDVDQIVVDGKAYRRAAFLVLLPGKVLIKGMKSGTEVCSAELTLVAGVAAKFTC